MWGEDAMMCEWCGPGPVFFAGGAVLRSVCVRVDDLRNIFLQHQLDVYCMAVQYCTVPHGYERYSIPPKTKIPSIGFYVTFS